MDRAEVALRMFCAHLASGGKLTLHDTLGENEIKVSFALADTFLNVMKEEESRRGPTEAP